MNINQLSSFSFKEITKRHVRDSSNVMNAKTNVFNQFISQVVLFAVFEQIDADLVHYLPGHNQTHILVRIYHWNRNDGTNVISIWNVEKLTL